MMKKFTTAGVIVCCSALIFLACSSGDNHQFPDPFAQNERLGRGVNIPGSDPMWENLDSTRFREEYFSLIREGGFSTVRFNLHPFEYMDERNGFRLQDSWIRAFEWVIEKALENDLMIILDLHEHNSLGRELERWMPYFLPFWEQIASRYRDLPPEVIFELLNEPGRQITPEIWNGMMNDAIGVIRKTNPNRTIMTGPAYWYQRFEYLDSLKLPEDDRNLIITVHYYRPSAFTHQTAHWMEQWRDTSGVLWSSYPEERNRIISDFRQVQEWAERNNRPIHLGEFGVYGRGADLYSQVEWTSCVTRTAEKLGWSWSFWRFTGGFKVYDREREQWYTPIYDALIPKEEKSFNTEDSLLLEGQMRRYVVHLPSRKIGEDLPVVFGFHDEGKRPEDFKRWSQLDSVADSRDFIVVYPEAGLPELVWQPGTDTVFIRSILNRIYAAYHVDMQKTFATGFSAGAEMARFLGSPGSGLAKAVVSAEPEVDPAASASGDGGTYPSLDRKVPVQLTLIRNGREDLWPMQTEWGMDASEAMWDLFMKSINSEI